MYRAVEVGSLKQTTETVTRMDNICLHRTTFQLYFDTKKQKTKKHHDCLENDNKVDESTVTYSGIMEREAEGSVWDGGFNCKLQLRSDVFQRRWLPIASSLFN